MEEVSRALGEDRLPRWLTAFRDTLWTLYRCQQKLVRQSQSSPGEHPAMW